MSIIISSNNIKRGVEWVGKYVSSPEQRLILGATALATQPVIDMNNKNVDENTRMISVARTLGKIIAGTIVGVGVRYGSIELVKKFAKCTPILKDGFVEGFTKLNNSNIFTPVIEKLQKLPLNEFEKEYNSYVKAMGTLVATFAMLITNFAVDAPLTRVLTRYFHKKIVGKQPAGMEDKK